MMKIWIQGLFCMIRCAICVAAFGFSTWAQSDTTYRYTNHRLIGMRVSIGAASSPTSWYGLTIFGAQRHVEYHLSIAKSNLRRFSFGLNVLGDAQQKWTWCSGLYFSHTTASAFTFDPDGPTRREYLVSDGQFLHADASLMRRVRGYQKWDGRNLVFTVGYQWRISHYSIQASENTIPRQEEIERMAKDLFKSRWYWTLSFRFGEFWPKKATVLSP